MIRLLAIILFGAATAAAVADEPSDAYSAAKLPALSRAWHGTDYGAVAAAIEAKTIPLPRFSQESGAAILNRLTATENLVLLQNRNVAIQSRLGEMVAMGSPMPVAKTLPALKHQFAPDAINELREKLKGHRQGATKPADVTALDSMLAQLKN